MQRSFIIASLFAVLLAGCSNPDASVNGDAPMTPGKPQEGGKSYKIAFIPKGATHEFWKSMQSGADAASAENNVELLWKAPLKEDDKAEQIKVVENFTAQKVDGIVLAPLDQEALRAPVKEAIAAGIPVIIVDSGLKDVETTSYIATDNYAAGKLGGTRLATAVGKGARVIMLRYAEGSASTMEREKGFMDAAKEGGLIVVSEEQHAGATRESAQTASENLLARFKKGDGLDIAGIFCPNESAAFGMLKALQNAKLAGKVKFVGFDSSKELLAAVASGEMEGLVIQNPIKMGSEGVAKMVAHLKGEKIDAKVDTGATLLDKTNMNTPEVKAMLGLK